MFILLGYYLYTNNIIYSILIGTFIYLFFGDYKYIFGLYLLDIIFCVLLDNKYNNKKIKSKKIYKIKRFKLNPLDISLNYTLLHTYNNIYS